MDGLQRKSCNDDCTGKKTIFVYPRRLTGWRALVVNCSICGDLKEFDWNGKETRPIAKRRFWDTPLMTAVCGVFFLCFAAVQIVRFGRMFSAMDLASFGVWCFMWGGVAILVYGVTRE